jgi:PPOX class probable F420-dependent enzyme
MSFSTLATHEFINLITYRKSGVAVSTPVWFVQSQDTLYVMTGHNAGKVKRIRHTPQIHIEPCDRTGNTLGERMPAQARITEPSEHAHINQLLNRKYGLMKRMFDIMAIFNGGTKNRAFIAITAQPV